MKELFHTFPDAKIVQTHRDPVESIPSIASMIHYLWELGADHPDPLSAGAQWSKIFNDGTHATMAFRDAGHHQDFLDINFLDSVNNPLGVVNRIYNFLGKSLTPLAEEQMQHWTKDNAREKRPPHEYTLEKFGLSEETLAREFHAYSQRFLPPEG